MRKRLPFLVFAIGIIGVSTYARIVAHVGPAFLRTEAAVDFALGFFLCVELAGVVLIGRASRGKFSRCRRAIS
ncbi:MAG TPA: hypothetical protein VJZ00_04085 [Thermoanaerobaculia bacterium]|nr:hypothetical protein [Thermoanaerobaculia bacterium]